VLEGSPQYGGQLVVGVDVEPAMLNPIISTDWLGKRIVLRRIQQGLVRVDAADDPEYRIVPELAERWDVSPDGRRYIFHLRRGVTWHDGHAFGARDVIATLDKVFDPKTLAASTRADFAELEHYRAQDDWTVEFVWKRPYFLVLDALADLPIQPAHVIAALSAAQYNAAASNPLNRAPLGTGPFRFVSWENHSQIALERNPSYWGERAFVERLIFRIVPDANVRMQLAERGEIDLLYRLKTDQWTRAGSSGLRTHWHRSRFYASKYNWIGWNETQPFFADVRVRRALTLLIDRPSIIGKLMHGLPRPTSCHFYWASSACDPAQTPLPYDPEQAARLLDSADVRDHDGDGVRDRAGQPFRFALLLPSHATEAARIAAKIKEDLARAGIEMELETLEWSAFMQRVTDHAFDAISLLWGGDARMDPTQIWHSASRAGGSNFISYNNAEADRLIEQARVTLDADARAALFRRFGALLHADQPYTFLFVPAELDLLHERIKGARPNLYWWQFEELWLADAKGA
jgi:peptide/nickel transport system substrate-binding protein